MILERVHSAVGTRLVSLGTPQVQARPLLVTFVTTVYFALYQFASSFYQLPYPRGVLDLPKKKKTALSVSTQLSYLQTEHFVVMDLEYGKTVNNYLLKICENSSQLPKSFLL